MNWKGSKARIYVCTNDRTDKVRKVEYTYFRTTELMGIHKWLNRPAWKAAQRFWRDRGHKYLKTVSCKLPGPASEAGTRKEISKKTSWWPPEVKNILGASWSYFWKSGQTCFKTASSKPPGSTFVSRARNTSKLLLAGSQDFLLCLQPEMFLNNVLVVFWNYF